jgi:RHS repeat-associated protein
MLPSRTYGKIAQRVFFNAVGELTQADHSVSNAFDRSFEFDSIGNRKKSADSLTLPATDNYTANALNQYSAVGVVARTFDDDGNLTDDGTKLYIWDAENRLIEVNMKSDNSTVATYAYDYQSRRITKTVDSTVTNFVYDEWNPIAEYSDTTLSKSYVWGMDISGWMQEAGGVSGLLAVSDTTATYYPTFDGNGNVSEYIDSTGIVVAHYEYDAFGKTIASGLKTGDFSHQFSTKQLDSETGLHYYGYRYYDSTNGRWLGRDPIGEAVGGFNLYSFVYNSALYAYDYLGLSKGQNNPPSYLDGIKCKDEAQALVNEKEKTPAAKKQAMRRWEKKHQLRHSSIKKCKAKKPRKGFIRVPGGNTPRSRCCPRLPSGSASGAGAAGAIVAIAEMAEATLRSIHACNCVKKSGKTGTAALLEFNLRYSDNPPRSPALVGIDPRKVKDYLDCK